jgi:hypothetical protein
MHDYTRSTPNLHQNSTSPKLQRALALAKLGFRVHPVEDGTRKPHLTGYADLATTDEAQLREWWARWPDANPGIICGPESGILILDVDKRNGGDTSLADLEAQYGELPVTWTVETRDGWHYYFRHPGDCSIRYGKLAPGIELLGAGRNAVGAGSYRRADKDGPEHTYEWLDCQRPTDIPLADLPHWLRLRAFERGLVQASTLPRLSTQTLGTSQVKAQKTRLHSGDDGEAGEGKISPTTGVLLLAESSTPLLEMSDFPAHIDKDFISALFTRWDVTKRCLDVLGLSHVTRTNQKFRCIIHRESDPSACIFKSAYNGGEYRYADHHSGKHEGTETTLTCSLITVYFAKKTGLPLTTRLNAPSYVTWALRLLIEAGVLPPHIIKAPRLKGETTFYEQVVYEGFQSLLAAKWLYERASTPFTHTFAAQWCHISPEHAAMAICGLLRKGYIMGTGDFAKNAAMFTLGTRSLINRRARRLKAQAKQHAPQPAKQADIVADIQPDIDATLKANEAQHGAYPDIDDPDFALVCPHGYETWATCEQCEAEADKRASPVCT